MLCHTYTCRAQGMRTMKWLCKFSRAHTTNSQQQESAKEQVYYIAH